MCCSSWGHKESDMTEQLNGLMDKNPLEENGVVIIVNKRIQNAVVGCNLKNNRMISVYSQGKPFISQ